MHFDRKKIDAVVEERLEEIFEKIRKELKRAGFDRKLPEGIVLTGGGAKMRGIDGFAKKILEASVKIGEIGDYSGGVADAIKKPEYATAIGLAMIAMEGGGAIKTPKSKKKTGKKEKKEGFLRKFFKKF